MVRDDFCYKQLSKFSTPDYNQPHACSLKIPPTHMVGAWCTVLWKLGIVVVGILTYCISTSRCLSGAIWQDSMVNKLHHQKGMSQLESSRKTVRFLHFTYRYYYKFVLTGLLVNKR